MAINLTLRQVRAFVAIANFGGFTEASTRLHVSQAALSGALKDLEEALGAELLHRTTRKVRLSDAGAAFLPLAERLLRDLDVAVDAVSEWKQQAGSVVRVAVPQLMACTLLPEAIAAFRKDHPATQVRVVDSPPEAVVARVLAGEVDFGIGPQRAVSSEVAASTLFEMPFLAVFPQGHALGALREVSWAALSAYDLISLQGEYTPLLNTELAASRRKVTLSPAHEVAFVTTALSMVRAGLGVTTCMPYAQSLIGIQQLQARVLVKPTITRKFLVWTRRDRQLSPAAAGFKEFLQRFLGEDARYMATPRKAPASKGALR
jgi:DNA-binding transcriptional LysR family regulator